MYLKSLFTHILSGLRLDSYKAFWKVLVIVIPFFTGTTHVYLLKISITHNRKRILLSTPQILSVKDKCTFRYSNFVIIDLCNYSANSWFEIISLLTPLPEVDFSHVAKVSDYASKVSFLSKYL